MATTSASIPAANYVSVTPGVVTAGAGALDLIGLALTQSNRVPIGTVYSFASASAVASFFGPGSESSFASVYFLGYDNSTIKPGAVLFAQYAWAAPVSAYLWGGQISNLPLSQLGQIGGTLTLTMDGVPRTGTINLTGATSFSNAANLIQTQMNTALPSEATGTGAVGATFTGTQTGTNLVATAVTGLISVGDTISGTGVASGTTIVSGPTAGGAGTYVTSLAGTAAAAAITSTSNVLNVTAATGTIAIGQTITAVGFTAAVITGLGTGSGGIGTYIFGGPQQALTSKALTLQATGVAVTYDATSGAFVVTSGVAGPASSAAFATGAAAAPLLLTQATGATISQGAAISTPATAMTTLTAITTAFASFTTVGFQPLTADKVALAQWNNSQVNRYVYAGWDTDVTVTTPNNSLSFGYAVTQAGYGGTALLYEPSNEEIAAFLMGCIASVDFTQQGGSIDYSYKGQTGLATGVSNQTIANQLELNGYNYYGAVASQRDGFNFFYPGLVSGPYKTLRPYVEQIWLNNNFQIALLSLLTTVNKIPYNPAGMGLIRAACLDPITAAVSFGAIEPNVTLSQAQVTEVNSAAGTQIDTSLSTVGWYLQILPASAQTRARGGTPPITFWYMDGGAVRRLNIASIDVQ